MKLARLIVFLLINSPAFAAVAFVSAKTATAPNGTAPAINLATGNALVVGCSTGDTGSITVTSVTDTAGNTFSPATNLITNPGRSGSIRMYYVLNATGNASDVVVCHQSGGGWADITVLEFSGVATTLALDQTASVSETEWVTSMTSGSFTPVITDEVAVACGQWASAGNAVVAGTGYTVPTGGTDSTNGWGCEYKLSIGTSAQAATMTDATNQYAAMAVATFSPTAIVPASGVVQQHRVTMQ